MKDQEVSGEENNSIGCQKECEHVKQRQEEVFPLSLQNEIFDGVPTTKVQQACVCR